MKSRKRVFVPISLKPEETGTLSLISDYYFVPKVREFLLQLAKGTTPRTYAIAKKMLGPKKDRTGIYGFMAQRFIDASENNLVQGRILYQNLLCQLHVDRGI